MSFSFDKNLGVMWAMIVGTASAIVWMFSNFVSASEFQEYVTDQHYNIYYELEAKIIEAEAKDQDALAENFRQLQERLKAKICKQEPEWDKCDAAG